MEIKLIFSCICKISSSSWLIFLIFYCCLLSISDSSYIFSLEIVGAVSFCSLRLPTLKMLFLRYSRGIISWLNLTLLLLLLDAFSFKCVIFLSSMLILRCIYSRYLSFCWSRLNSSKSRQLYFNLSSSRLLRSYLALRRPAGTFEDDWEFVEESFDDFEVFLQHLLV